MGGEKEEKQNSDIRGKKKAFSFVEALPGMMTEIGKKMCPGAAQPEQREKRPRGVILVRLMDKTMGAKAIGKEKKR